MGVAPEDLFVESPLPPQSGEIKTRARLNEPASASACCASATKYLTASTNYNNNPDAVLGASCCENHKLPISYFESSADSRKISAEPGGNTETTNMSNTVSTTIGMVSDFVYTIADTLGVVMNSSSSTCSPDDDGIISLFPDKNARNLEVVMTSDGTDADNKSIMPTLKHNITRVVMTSDQANYIWHDPEFKQPATHLTDICGNIKQTAWDLHNIACAAANNAAKVFKQYYNRYYNDIASFLILIVLSTLMYAGLLSTIITTKAMFQIKDINVTNLNQAVYINKMNHRICFQLGLGWCFLFGIRSTAWLNMEIYTLASIYSCLSAIYSAKRIGRCAFSKAKEPQRPVVTTTPISTRANT